MAFRKVFVLSICLFFTSFSAIAQRLEFGLLLGGAYYYGDVVNELEVTTIRQAAGGFLRLHLNDRFAIKGFGGYARVTGDDKLSSSPWQKGRNWAFFTDIFEGSLQLEYNLIEDRNSGRKIRNPFIPYIFAGVGAFYFKPQTEHFGNAQSLAPLMTSGKKYEQIAAAVPVGVGFRYYLSKKIQVGFEVGFRYTSTSYIDDIGGSDKYVDPSITPYPSLVESLYSRSASNRNPGDARGKMGYTTLKLNDSYLIGGVTISYRFSKGGGGGGGRGFGGKAIRCPRFY